MNVGLAVTRSARRYPTAPALFDDQRTMSYATLDERSTRFANLLQGRFGIERGDRVALLIHNRMEVVEVLAGAAKAGAVYVGLNFRLGWPDYESIFENAEPRLLVTESEFSETAQRISEMFDIPVVGIDDVGPRGYEALLAAASANPPETLHLIRPDDDFCIVYTSGTTGRPKGVLFDHGAALQHATTALLEYEIGNQSRWLMMIPHNSSVQITTLPCITVGAAIGFTDSRNFDGVQFASLVERHHATHSFLVPTMLFRLLEQVPSAEPLRSLETLGYGASPISPDRLRELVDRFGPIFNQLYGMAEVASIGTMLRKNEHVRGLAEKPKLLASAGQPSYAIDVRVVDASRRDVGVGERGEVIFGGPYVMKGYFRDPERTEEALIDGWMHSGDIAEIDDEGYIYIVDRKKDMIIRGGYNITPTEIENVLYRHSAVLEASVIGVPDPEWGEAVMAVVALKQGQSASAKELTDLCRAAGLPTIKLPERVEFMESLPKNAVGKIAKRELRDRYWTAERKV